MRIRLPHTRTDRVNMPTPASRLQIVRSRLTEEDFTRAAAEALRLARPEEVPLLADIVLELPTPAGIAAAVERYTDLDEVQRAALPALPRTPLAAGLCRICGASRKEATWEHVLEIVEAAQDPALAEAARDLLFITFEKGLLTMTARAARLLLLMAQKDAATDGTPGQQLDQAIGSALARYRMHRQPEILVAAALLARRAGGVGQRITQWLLEADHPARMALPGALKRLPDTLVDAHLLRWCKNDLLASQCVARIAARIAGPASPEPLLAHADELDDTDIRRFLRGTDRRRLLPPPSFDPTTLSPQGQRGFVKWIETLERDNASITARLRLSPAFTDERARLRAVAALVRTGHESARPVLSAFALDRSRRVARFAIRAILRSPLSESVGLLELFARAPHALVAMKAQGRLASRNIDAFWLMADDREPAHPSVHESARSFLSTAPTRFIAVLRRRISSGNVGVALPALRLIASLDRNTPSDSSASLAQHCELELLVLAAGTEARLASAALTCLASVPTASARKMILAALAHEDDRVRANAVEALSLDESRAIEDRLRAMAHSPANRLRANAIRSLLHAEPKGGPCVEPLLGAMLEDPRPLHRASALWVVEVEKLAAHVPLVANSLRHDTDPSVSRRAKAAARALLPHLDVHDPSLVTALAA